MTGGYNGGARPSDLTLRLVELLEYAGEQGMERQALIREVGKAIPPGRAIREAERGRLKSGGIVRKVPEQRVVPASDDRQIQTGRRALANSALRAHRASIEQYADADGVIWVRLKSLPPSVAYVRAQEERATNMTDTANPEET